MIYTKFKDIEISRLGFGIMRMPTLSDGTIDEAAAMKMIERALAGGINYFDTGYFYHSGKSEKFIGQAFRNFPRESWYLSNKMPGNMMTYNDGVLRLEVSGFNMESKTLSGPGDVFEYQMDLCGVDYFDFYMLHNVSETTYDIYTNEKVGIVEYLIEQKKAGRIKHLGFSSHGRAETIEKFLDLLETRGQGDAMEFCMIQLNYLDWTLQDAGTKYELLTKRGIPVWVMEPVRGGKLNDLKGAAANMLKAARPQDSQASWAFRHLQSLDNVGLVLSGMSTMEQLEENLALFSNADPMTPEESAVLDRVVEAMAQFVPCTSCQYCIAACPAGLDIPLLLSMYNEASYDVFWTIRAALRALGDGKRPSDCTACGLCNPLCPQNIDIPAALKKFDELLG
ncbi:MAG: aldo/keto reductase [Defluviitaleaceae bacterium]|nr:aldo/keto reductase [Defluviitaleaceae bacterium]